MKTSLLDAGHQPRQRIDGLRAPAARAAPARAGGSPRSASRCVPVIWAMSPTLQAPLTMTKRSSPRLTNIRSSMMRAFVGQQQAVALLARRQADHVDRHQRLEGCGGIRPDQPQLPHVRDVEQACASCACGGARPSGRRGTGPASSSRRRAPCGRPVPGAGRAAGSSEALVRAMRTRGTLRSSGADRTMVHTMGGPCCPLYLRDSPRYAGLLLRWAACPIGRRPLSSKVNAPRSGRLVSPFA